MTKNQPAFYGPKKFVICSSLATLRNDDLSIYVLSEILNLQQFKQKFPNFGKKIHTSQKLHSDTRRVFNTVQQEEARAEHIN